MVSHSEVRPAMNWVRAANFVTVSYRAHAKLAAALGKEEEAAGFAAQADAVYERFNERLWCEDLSAYAIALDGGKRRCCVVAFNAGQCLITGIASPERAERTAQTLLSDRSYSGLGIRTVASSESRFNLMMRR